MSRGHSSRRIHFLDELRGLCVILMVFYHAFYTAGFMFGLPIAQKLFMFFQPVEPLFAGVFVFLCGMCCNFSHNNLKRGALLAGVAVAMSLVLWGAVKQSWLRSDSVIWFGILHCLAACILLYVLLRPTIRLIPAWLGLLICALLFVLCWHVPLDEGGYFGIAGVFRWYIPHADGMNPFLYPFGLCRSSAAGDYFPLIPWFFHFLGGTYFGTWKMPRWMSRSRFPLFSKVGKYAIWIYLAHQPVIYGLCYGIYLLVNAI